MHLKYQPLVTLYIVATNHEQFIEQAILSMVNQTYENTELIVVHNGSADNTGEIINKLKRKYNFTFIQEKNYGLPHALNQIISLAKGKYLAGCSADDYLPLHKTEKQVEFLENHSEFAACGGNAPIVDEFGNIIKINQIEDSSYKIIEFEDVFLYNRSFPAGSVMINLDILKEVGGYSTIYPTEDKYMWLKITSKGYKMARLNMNLQFYRKHGNNISNNYDFMLENIKNCLDIYESHILYPKAINNYHVEFFNMYSIVDRKLSIKEFKKIKLSELDKESFIQLIKGVLKFILPRSLLKIIGRNKVV
ncbi:MAG: glycosyltransferase [Bacteroidetes bacterium]|nr:glycosyltransferase [Bacteroidota bacterium]